MRALVTAISGEVPPALVPVRRWCWWWSTIPCCFPRWTAPKAATLDSQGVFHEPSFDFDWGYCSHARACCDVAASREPQEVKWTIGMDDGVVILEGPVWKAVPGDAQKTTAMTSPVRRARLAMGRVVQLPATVRLYTVD